MTLAPVDRLIHHGTIFELNIESYRKKAAKPHRPEDAGWEG